MNLQEHIQRYVELACRADRLFELVQQRHGDLLRCKPGCDDCCSVFFQLSLIEAFYVSGMFWQMLGPSLRERALARAEQSGAVFQQAADMLSGMENADKEELSEAAAKLKIPCPLLEDNGCALYEHRPITCRLYGVPEKIGSKVVSCPHNGFRANCEYTTVDVNEIQEILYQYSREFLEDLIGRGPSVPPGPLFSMAQALRTSFDRSFFETLRETLP
jgi:Fe-S-cluster containining protein